MTQNNDGFIIKNGILTKYAGPGGDIVIPDGVTEIGGAAFHGCTGLTDISMPDSVAVIGKTAFHGCPDLTVHAPAGSYAARYTRKAGIRFKTTPKRKKRAACPGGGNNTGSGSIHIRTSFSKTMVTVTDALGNPVSWASADGQVFRDGRKSMSVAAQTAARTAARAAAEQGLRTVEVIVQGPGPGRLAAIRALQAAGLEVTMIKDVTPIPHNGYRSPKHRCVR